MVSTILLPILSGSVVLVQRRVDTSADYNTDYDTNSVTNPDNIDLAGGYYNSYQEDPYNTVEDPYNTASSNTNQNYYDPYYGYNYAGKYFIFNFVFYFILRKGYLPNLLESALCHQIFVFWARDLKFWLQLRFFEPVKMARSDLT